MGFPEKGSVKLPYRYLACPLKTSVEWQGQRRQRALQSVSLDIARTLGKFACRLKVEAPKTTGAMVKTPVKRKTKRMYNMGCFSKGYSRLNIRSFDHSSDEHKDARNHGLWNPADGPEA